MLHCNYVQGIRHINIRDIVLIAVNTTITVFWECDAV
jgi:CO dehydrogenase/acetyl-CoA synthase beta subunit